MELLDRLGQKIGESVGIYSRTADEDEVFVRHEKLADATRFVFSLFNYFLNESKFQSSAPHARIV
jgi:hypothetical protein